MKNVLIRLFMMLGILVFAYGCSADDDSGNSDFNDLIIDDNVSEKWDGSGVPSWLSDRFFTFKMNETEWTYESYWGPTLCNVYKLVYEENLLLLLEYNRFGLHDNAYYNVSDVLCYTDDGRRVKLNDRIKDCYKKEAELVWTNELGSEGNEIKIEEYDLANVESLGWLQNAIDKICEDIKEPEQVLFGLAFGCVQHEAKDYVILRYEYFDKNNYQNGIITTYNIYTTHGGKTDISIEKINLNSTKLCGKIIEEL